MADLKVRAAYNGELRADLKVRTTYDGDSRPHSEKPQRLGASDCPGFDGIPVKQLETGPFLSTERILNIIPQISRAHGLPFRCARKILPGNFLGVLETSIARTLQGGDVARRQTAVPA